MDGDRNGVTEIPLPLAGAVAEACGEFVAAESVVLDYLKGPRVTAEGFAAARKECQRRIADLAHRLKSRAAAADGDVGRGG